MRRATKLWIPSKPNILRCAADVRRANFLPGWTPGAAGAGGGGGFVDAFPTVAATNISVHSGTSHSVALPSNISAGDLLIIGISSQTSSSVNFSTPAGWNQVVHQTTESVTLAIYYKIATGSEGSSVTVTSSGSTNSAHNSYRITGAELVFGDSAASASTPEVNAPWGVAKNLWLAFLGASAGVATTVSAPTNYSDKINAGVGTIISAGCASARRFLEAETEGPVIWSSGIASALVVVSPAIS